MTPPTFVRNAVPVNAVDRYCQMQSHATHLSIVAHPDDTITPPTSLPDAVPFNAVDPERRTGDNALIERLCRQARRIALGSGSARPNQCGVALVQTFGHDVSADTVDRFCKGSAAAIDLDCLRSTSPVCGGEIGSFLQGALHWYAPADGFRI